MFLFAVLFYCYILEPFFPVVNVNITNVSQLISRCTWSKHGPSQCNSFETMTSQKNQPFEYMMLELWENGDHRHQVIHKIEFARLR